MMVLEDELSKNSEKESSLDEEKSPSTLTDLHCHQQHARNERLLNLRKIKSRNAARTRRGKENYEFYELAKLLPIPIETSSQLDKASIVRLTMSFLKMREFNFCIEPSWTLSNEGPPPNRTVKDASRPVISSLKQITMTKEIEEQLGSRILQSLDGFMFVLNCSGRFLYVSETVSIFLGLSQVEMIGSSIFDYTYPDDRNELAVHLSLMLSSSSQNNIDVTTTSTGSNAKKSSENGKDCLRSFFIRMKSTLTKRGVTPKSSYYKVVHICTRAQRAVTKRNGAKNHSTRDENNNQAKDIGTSSGLIGLIGFGATLPPHSLSELPLHQNIFTMRVNPSLHFTYCDPAIEEMLGYEVREVVGQCFYNSIHARDVNKIKKCHIELLTKGHVRTPYFRWMNKSGGYKWVYSTITLLANQRLYPEQSFIWINNVISDICEESQVMDLYQFPQEEIERRKNLLKVATEEKIKSTAKKSSPEKNTRQSMQNKNNAKKKEQTKLIEGPPPLIKSSNSSEDIIKDSSSTDCNDKSHTNNQVKENLELPDSCKNNNLPPKNTSVIHSKRKLSSTKSEESGLKEKRIDRKDSESTTVQNQDSANETTPQDPQDKICNDEEAVSDRDLMSDDSRKNDPLVSKPNDGNGVKIYCVTPDFSGVKISTKHLSKPIIYADSVSEYMDVDSTMWANPPNKEISNHNDLPPGIKHMPGLWSTRQTPSAVHHHYPFGIDPNLLHSNPLLAKFMMTGWPGGCHRLPGANAFMVAAPVQFMPPVHLPEHLDQNSTLKTNQATQASVAAVLEELKKDPLHKVNPPNKVVLPSLQEDGLNKTTIISGSKNLLHSAPCFSMSQSLSGGKPSFVNKSDELTTVAQASATALPSRTLATLNLYTNEVLNQHVRAQTVIQVPSTILVPTNGMVFNGTESSPLIAINSDSGLKIPIAPTTFQQHVNPCVIQPFSFPQVPKVRSVPY